MGSIELKQVRKDFGEVKVINDVSLKIDDGQFAVFVGPSGCGKSTLLRLVAGLEDITAGQILIDGKDVSTVGPGATGAGDGVPVLRALPAYERARQYRVRAENGQAAHGRDRSEGQESGRDPQPDRLSRSEAAPALGRPAPARRDRPRDRARAQGLPVRRTALQSRRGLARADAARDRRPPPCPQDDDDLCDA